MQKTHIPHTKNPFLIILVVLVNTMTPSHARMNESKNMILPWLIIAVSRVNLLGIVMFLSGQERFGNMTRVYYKEAVGCILVFDVTRPASFEAVQKWKLDLDTKVQLPNGGRIPCVLMGNKVSRNTLRFFAMKYSARGADTGHRSPKVQTIFISTGFYCIIKI